jgi:hypothetical protein
MGKCVLSLFTRVAPAQYLLIYRSRAEVDGQKVQIHLAHIVFTLYKRLSCGTIIPYIRGHIILCGSPNSFPILKISFLDFFLS